MSDKTVVVVFTDGLIFISKASSFVFATAVSRENLRQDGHDGEFVGGGKLASHVSRVNLAEATTAPGQSSLPRTTSTSPEIAKTSIDNVKDNRQGRAGQDSTTNESILHSTQDLSGPLNPRIPSPSYQPAYPGPAQEAAILTSPESTSQQNTQRWSFKNAFLPFVGGPTTSNPSNAKRPLSVAPPLINTTSQASRNRHRHRQQHPILPRQRPLWNPANSTPRGPNPVLARTYSDTKHQTYEEPQAPVRLVHPQITEPRVLVGTAEGDCPLLSPNEQRQSRHSASLEPASAQASFQVERNDTSSKKISLPKTLLDKNDKGKGRDTTTDLGESGAGIAVNRKPTGRRKRGQSVTSAQRGGSPLNYNNTNRMMADVEANVVRSSADPRRSDASGIGPALSARSFASSSDSSMRGSEHDPGQNEMEWGPSHPCYPHLNPHIPVSTPLYASTRIIRIKRNWMISGDLAPTFSDVYPVVLADAGLEELEFRRIVERLNQELIKAWSPYSARNMFDSFMGLITGYVWDDLGVTGIKGKLKSVEIMLENENKSLEAHGATAKLIALRKTGYLCVSSYQSEIQISSLTYHPVGHPDSHTSDW